MNSTVHRTSLRWDRLAGVFGPVLLIGLLALAWFRLPGIADGLSSQEETGRITGDPVAVSADHPAVTRLTPDLRSALRRAAKAARADGVRVRVTSGWRSAAYQQSLLDDAVEQYGSLAEARKWVQTPEGSQHTRGQAVDVGPRPAAAWMAEHGSEFGLCQTYANELWHYEVLTSPGGTCPEQQADGSGPG